MASSTANGSASSREGSVKISMTWLSAVTSRRAPVKITCSASPRAAAVSSSSAANGPVPTMRNLVSGRCVATSLAI